MKKGFVMFLATTFYWLSRSVSRLDRTPYFMHQSLKYKAIRVVYTNSLKLSNKLVDLS